MREDIKNRIEQIIKERNLINWTFPLIDDLFYEVSEKNHGNETVLTIMQGTGTVPREQSGRDIIYDKENLQNYKFVKKGDFIIHLRSFEGGLEIANQDGIVSPAYIILRPKKNISSAFFYALFHTNQFINQTMAPAVEGVRDGRSVKYDVLKKQPIIIPDIYSQQKIAEILSTQDKIIELKQKLIEQKKNQKKHLMNNFLTGKIRFKDFANKWNEEKLGNLCNITTGKLDANAMVDNGKYPFFTCAKEVFSIDNYAFDTNAILISGNGANVGYIHLYNGKFNAYQRTYVLDKFSCDILYLKFYLEKNLSKRIYKEKNEGNTPYIILSTLSEMEIKVPSRPEQQAIATILSTADKEIELLQQELEQEKLKKKSLSQLLLTGIVRVNCNN